MGISELPKNCLDETPQLGIPMCICRKHRCSQYLCVSCHQTDAALLKGEQNQEGRKFSACPPTPPIDGAAITLQVHESKKKHVQAGWGIKMESRRWRGLFQVMKMLMDNH